MRCPFCHSQNDKVVNSRLCQEGDSIRRRRECLDCGKRFTTFEYIEEAEMHVIKRNRQRETYDRAKLKKGIWRACEKRPVSEADIDAIIVDIEKEIQNRMDAEISSLEIGEMVLKHLREKDDVVYE